MTMATAPCTPTMTDLKARTYMVGWKQGSGVHLRSVADTVAPCFISTVASSKIESAIAVLRAVFPLTSRASSSICLSFTNHHGGLTCKGKYAPLVMATLESGWQALLWTYHQRLLSWAHHLASIALIESSQHLQGDASMFDLSR